MNKICIVNVFFGNYPNHFNLWLKSACFNKNIDFLLFTNKENIEKYNKVYQNIYFYESSIENIKQRLSTFFKTDVCLEKPYKLCDYKPFYCFIFEEIEHYDYWGFCDLDLILGDISIFIHENNLYKYDVIGTKGHFQLMRNCPKINNLILSIPCAELEKVIKTNQNLYFDERLFSRYSLYPNNERKLNVENCVADVKSMATGNSLRHFHFKIYGQDKDNSKIKRYYYFCDGLTEITKMGKNETKRKILYFHFQKRKMKNYVNNKETFLAIPNRFIECNNILEAVNKSKFVFLDYLNSIWVYKKKNIMEFSQKR